MGRQQVREGGPSPNVRGQWLVDANSAASDIAIRVTPSDITLYWTGLNNGDHVEAATADAGGCNAAFVTL